MKPIFLLILLAIISHIAYAQSGYFMDDDGQYAIIKDTDGFVNIHRGPSIDSPIVGKIWNYSIFTCETNKTNWWKVLQADNQNKSNWLEGYIYKNRVTLLKDWKVMERSNTHLDSGIFKSDSIIVSIKRKAFNPKKHKLLYYRYDQEENTNRYINKIDGKLYWGTDGEMPKKVISSVKIMKNGSVIQLPKTAFDDLYEPSFRSVSICAGYENTLYISMSNSDGAGAYSIIWILKDNKYLDRYIDDSNE